MDLTELTELVLALLLMGLLVQTELAITGLLGGILLLQIGLPGRTELVLTTLKMDF